MTELQKTLKETGRVFWLTDGTWKVFYDLTASDADKIEKIEYSDGSIDRMNDYMRGVIKRDIKRKEGESK